MGEVAVVLRTAAKRHGLTPTAGVGRWGDVVKRVDAKQAGSERAAQLVEPSDEDGTVRSGELTAYRGR